VGRRLEAERKEYDATACAAIILGGLCYEFVNTRGGPREFLRLRSQTRSAQEGHKRRMTEEELAAYPPALSE